MALLSGGIDSPVAAWRMMKRGCTVVLVHFHAFPLQDHTTIDKARELARVLTRYQFRSRLLLVPFGAVQQTIVAACPAPLRVVLYRRFMVRIAEALAARATGPRRWSPGESLGQVASQTLDNMAVIDEAARGPVLRPLVGMDKEEITQQARRIGTFEISTLPDQDCCQLFVPRSPATAATLAEVREAEAALDVRRPGGGGGRADGRGALRASPMPRVHPSTSQEHLPWTDPREPVRRARVASPTRAWTSREAALLIACEEYPDLDVAPLPGRLDALAASVRRAPGRRCRRATAAVAR